MGRGGSRRKVLHTCKFCLEHQEESHPPGSPSTQQSLQAPESSLSQSGLAAATLERGRVR